MRLLVHVLSLWSLSLLFFAPNLVRADICMDRADREARVTYDRVLQACRAGNIDCRVDSDCSFGQTCNGGRCVATPTDCVRRCAARDSSGNCYSYGQDYCDYNPTCVENCQARDSSGNCYAYGQDICGREPLSCVSRCSARSDNGQCYAYSTDYCGVAPSCRSNCTARDSNGNCYAYGQDICTGG